MYSKVFFLILSFIIFSGFNVNAQYNNNSVGLAPETTLPVSPGLSGDNILNSYSRGFVCISVTSSHQWYKHFMGAPSQWTPIGGPFTAAGWLGAAARNVFTGVIYTNNQASPFQIWSLDTNTGAATQVVGACTGIPHANFTGMVFDHTTNQMFGLSTDLSTTQIFKINMTTGNCTPVGSPSSVCAAGLTLACSPCGTFFVVDIVGNNLYRVNKTTGVFLLVGSLGFDPNYSQDGAFDLSDGKFYLAEGSSLRICDTTTGSATTIIGTYPGQPTCLAIVSQPGPSVIHTPLQNTQNLAGPYNVNAVVTPQGSPISTSKIFWSRNNTVITDSIIMTNTSGTNWTGAIPGSGSPATYRYFIKALDSLGRAGYHPFLPPAVNTFNAVGVDTSKPIITHTPIGPTPKAAWPINCSANVTDNIGIDSVWVRWRKNSGVTKHFKLLCTSGSSYTALFNSVNADVNFADVIYYKIFAQDASAQHLKDSTPLYNFNIIFLNQACLGTGTLSSNYPFTTYWMDGRTQMLFTAAEINAAGFMTPNYIRKIGFNVISVGGPVMNGFNIKIQHTTLTSLTGFVTTGWTTVYSGTYAPPGTGWQYINLTSPYFYYNGMSNLLVEICYDNSAYTAYSPVYATTNPGMTWGYYTDNVDGCSLSGGSSQTNRPNMCLYDIIDLISINNNGVPSKYSLSQNYPNPFNPVTRINFDIIKQGLVTLKIYDILGREIKTLVNEIKSPGKFSVDFNASEFSSGIYFYKIIAGDFSDTKKMILVK